MDKPFDCRCCCCCCYKPIDIYSFESSYIKRSIRMKNEWIFFPFLLRLLLLCHHRVFVESRLCGKLSCEWEREEIRRKRRGAERRNRPSRERRASRIYIELCRRRRLFLLRWRRRGIAILLVLTLSLRPPRPISSSFLV